VVLARPARPARGRTRGSSSRARPRHALERRRRAARGRGSCARSRRSRSGRAAGAGAAPPRSARQVAGIGAGEDLLAGLVDHTPRGARPRAGRRPARELVYEGRSRSCMSVRIRRYPGAQREAALPLLLAVVVVLAPAASARHAALITSRASSRPTGSRSPHARRS
jgi:hypothetical protein